LRFYLIKIAITTILIVLISEIAKRSSLAGALLASIPLVSSLAIVWLYIDTKDIDKVVTLSNSIFWLVLPSLVLFITLPLLLKNGVHFYTSMSISIGLTIVAYWLMILITNFYGITL
jgi:hypothetical protein